MGCMGAKKAVVEPQRVVSPVPAQVQSGVKLNLFTVSEEMSGVEESQRRKSEPSVYPV